MGHDLHRRKIRIQEQPLSVVKEKTPSFPRREKSLQVQEKHNFEHLFGQPYLDQVCLLKRNASDEHGIQYNSSGNKAHNIDELVKNMSNLPGFLQRVEKKRNIQEKALNFGVLDWKSLEKWKFNERMPGKYIRKTSLSSSNLFSTPEGPPKISPNLRKQPSSHDHHPSSSPGKPPISNSSTFKTLSQSRPPALNSLHLNEEKKYVVALMHDKINSHEQKNEPIFGELNLTSERFPSQLQNVKLQEPEHFPCRQRSCFESSQCTEFRTSFDEQICEEFGRRMSSCFSPRECYSGELSARISPLFSQSSVVTVPTESNTTSPSEGKCSAAQEKTTRHLFSVEGSKETRADVSENHSFHGRHPSPVHRFSFNLGRMSRSFSFKESFAVAQLNPVHTAAKSETAIPKISPNVDSFDRDTSNTRTRGRSSPLRRLLDPLLKHKGAQSKAVHPPNGSVQPMTSAGMANKGLSQDKKPATSTLKALFHLALKNGLPFFKFVLENRIDKLAAVMHGHPQSGKRDNVFAFYSLHEIRKKGMNWMSQVSKATDSNGLGYSIVGQMKISSSCIAEDSGQCVVRECVLYGVDPMVIIKQTHEFLPNKEIAAIVVKNSVEKFNDKESSRAKGIHNGNTQENETSDSTVVILPGGVHGIPIIGAPSPLISRWRSCGACDCGGWDTGCKLQVLTSHHENCCKILEQSISKSAIDLVKLFVQEGQHKNKLVLTLEPVGNGIYSVAFDASISNLQAFATCVASVTCCKFSKILDANEHSDTDFIPELNMGTAHMKPSTFQEPPPAEYSTCPPLSPVGRI